MSHCRFDATAFVKATVSPGTAGMLGLKVYAPPVAATDLREITRPVGERTVSSTPVAPDQNPPAMVMPVLLAGLWRTMLNRVSAGLPEDENWP